VKELIALVGMARQENNYVLWYQSDYVRG